MFHDVSLPGSFAPFTNSRMFGFSRMIQSSLALLLAPESISFLIESGEYLTLAPIFIHSGGWRNNRRRRMVATETLSSIATSRSVKRVSSMFAVAMQSSPGGFLATAI
jgi:hypothetical protein